MSYVLNSRHCDAYCGNGCSGYENACAGCYGTSGCHCGEGAGYRCAGCRSAGCGAGCGCAGCRSAGGCAGCGCAGCRSTGGCGAGCGCAGCRGTGCGAGCGARSLCGGGFYSACSCGAYGCGCQRYCRNVIYRGPCPPSPCCPCQPPLPPPPLDPPCYEPCATECEDDAVYAYYAQTGTLVVGKSGGSLPLSTIMHESGAFSQSDNIVTICRPGTYLASFLISLPASAQTVTQLALLEDEREVPGSLLNIEKQSGAPGTFSFQAVFTVCECGAKLRVTSSAPISVLAEAQSDTVASLSLTRLR